MTAHPLELSTTFSLSSGDQRCGTERRMALLAAIGTEGSISAAARKVGLSYKAAWDAVDMMNNHAGALLVERVTGGRRGGGAALTARAQELLNWYDAAHAEHRRFMDMLSRFGPDSLDNLDLLHGMALQTSARNRFRGVVRKILHDGINDHVYLNIDAPHGSSSGPGSDHALVATITHTSTEHLALAPGRRALAFIKAQAITVAHVADSGVRHPAGRGPHNCWRGVVAHYAESGPAAEIGLDITADVRITGFARPEGARPKLGACAVARFSADDVLLGTLD